MKNYPLIVIGAGAAGLVIAIGATKAGKKVLLIEKGLYGGDCTNFGCIPSKALIASAHAAHNIKNAKQFGIECASSTFSADGSLKRVQDIVKDVRSHEDPDALAKMGVETLDGEASFVDPHTLNVNGETIFAKQIVIATGSSPFIPQIEGLGTTPFLTNETVFNLSRIPKSMAVLGGGPIGAELAQAFQRLGSKVSLIHSHDTILDREDPLAQEVVAKQLQKDGISLHLNTKPTNIQYVNEKFQIDPNIETDALVIATGRRPNVSSLQLENAKVLFSEKGISVDAYGRTNQSHIWAVGDVAGAPFFTHFAEHQARAVLTSILLPFKKKIKSRQIPRVTFTDPEVASVGLSEEEAAKKHTIASYMVPFSSVDRAITDSREEGFIKIITKKWTSQILGCTIVGPRAGEMIGEVLLAMHAKIPLRKLSSLIHPYPIYNQAIRKAADMWLTQTVLSLFRKKS